MAATEKGSFRGFPKRRPVAGLAGHQGEIVETLDFVDVTRGPGELRASPMASNQQLPQLPADRLPERTG